MRALLCTFLLLIAAAAAAQDWTLVPLGTTADILHIEDHSGTMLWAVGRGGFATKSDVAHEIWTQQDVGTSADLNSVLQPASGQVWLGAGAGVVRRLINSAWVGRNLPVSNEDFHLFSRGSGTAGAVGSGGSIYLTVNGGDTWTLKLNAGVPLHGGKGFVTSIHWVVGDAGTILKTSDGGDSYTALASGTTADLYAFLEGGGGAYFAVGAQGTILKSTDGGLTWSPRSSGTFQTLRAISYSGQNANWMIVAGEGGVMFRTTTGGGDCISVAADYLPPARLELDLYPNPLLGAGRLEFAAERGGDFSLAVFDVAGRRLLSLDRGRLAAGERRSAALLSGNLPAGVYFVRLELDGERVGRRFTVLR